LLKIKVVVFLKILILISAINLFAEDANTNIYNSDKHDYIKQVKGDNTDDFILSLNVVPQKKVALNDNIIISINITESNKYKYGAWSDNGGTEFILTDKNGEVHPL